MKQSSTVLHANAYPEPERERILRAYTKHVAEQGRPNWSALGRALGRDRTAVRDFIIAHLAANGQSVPEPEVLPVPTLSAKPAADAEKTKFNAEGNLATAEWQTEDVKTLEELLTVCNVDLNVWKVDKYICNKWAVGTKMPDGSVAKTPLFQIKAWLVRAVIEPTEFAPVAPIEIRLPARAQAPAIIHTRGSKIRRAVIWPDAQVGFKRDLITGRLTPLHDRRAIDVALQLTRYIKPDRVVWLGDMTDFPDWSVKYLVSPECVQTTQPTLVELAWICAQVRMINPEMRIDWIEGNHEARLEIALKTNSRQAYGLRPADDLYGPPMLSLPRLLNLASLDISYIGPYPGGEVWLNPAFSLQHGHLVRGKSGKTAAAMVEEYEGGGGCGHLHRVEMATKTVWVGNQPRFRQQWSFGSLCSIRPGVVPGMSPKPNWQNAIGEVQYEEGGEGYTVTPILIREGVAIYDCRRFEARSDDVILQQVLDETGYDVRGGK